MIILGAEIGLLIFGIYALVTGKLTLNKNRIVRGTAVLPGPDGVRVTTLASTRWPEPVGRLVRRLLDVRRPHRR